ncbi:Vps54 domain containing protein [Lactarius tabidus]
MSSHLLKTFRVSILQWTISTVINNPHKKSAPPKVHASVLPAPRIELPCVRRKDFPPYFFVIGSEWESFLHNLILGRAASTHLEQPNLDGPPDTLCTPCPPKLLPPLSSIPQIFFNPNFDLGDCRTFDTVAEVPSSSGSTSPVMYHDPSTLAHFLPLLEKLSHHADTLEQHLIREITTRDAESARYLARVQSLHAQLTAVRENSMHCRLCGVHCEVHLAHLRDVQVGIHAILGVVETVGVIRGLVNGREWGTALDGVDELHAGTVTISFTILDGMQAVVPPPMPSPKGTLLPSVLQEVQHAGPVSNIPLSKLKAFAVLPSQMQTLTQEIMSSITSELVALLKIGLSGYNWAMTDGLRPLIQGLVQTRNLRESVVWRDVVLGEVQGTVQQSVLCSILKTFLNCVEGLRTLNSNITQVLEDIRPPASPSELTVIHDSLFDTLSSSAESANMSISKVISAQADQHVKLDFCEFLETFNECWNFVVRCEIICRRMIWTQAHVPAPLQQVVNLILDAAVHDPRDLILNIETVVTAWSEPLMALLPIRPPSSPLLAPSQNSRPSVPSWGPRVDIVAPLIVNLRLLTTDTMLRVIEFLRAFNSRTCQVVLGAGAMRSAGLKNITAKHLALASQSLSIVIVFILYVREMSRWHLSPKQAVMLTEFDKLKHDYQEHQNDLRSVQLSGQIRVCLRSVLDSVRWENRVSNIREYGLTESEMANGVCFYPG